MTNSFSVGGIGNSNSLPSIYPTYAENGEIFNPGRFSPTPIFNGVPLNVMGAMTNPLWALNDFGGNETVRDVTQFGVSMDWQPINDININVKYNSQKDDVLSRGFNPSLGAIYPEQGFFLEGFYSESPTNSVREQFTATAEYTFSNLVSKGHNLNVLLGNEVLENQTTYGGNITNVGNYLTYDFDAANFALAEDPNSAIHRPNRIAEVGLVSYFTRVKYNYKQKYLATASIRNDRSSNFGPNF
jgi:hypothetical protein